MIRHRFIKVLLDQHGVERVARSDESWYAIDSEVRHSYAGVQRQATHLRAPPLGAVPPPCSRSFQVVWNWNRCNTGGGYEDSSSDISAPASDGNLIIHGDNLDALKALLPTHAGRVKCIYIDPPYNTGKENWCYNDNVNSPLMREWLKVNSPVDGEDLERHDKWLSMMWPRLHLLRELLSDDGAIFVSIDDNEQHHLRSIMDEVFGEENFVATIAVVSNLAGSSDQFAFAGAHEYCMVYAFNRSQAKFGRFAVSESALATWSEDEKGFYKPELLRRSSLTYSESLHFPIFVDEEGNVIVTDDDKKPTDREHVATVYPVTKNGKGIWRWSKKRIQENPSDVFAKHRGDGSVAVYSKQRPQLGDLPTEKPKTVFYKPGYSSRAGGQELKEILPEQNPRFRYPKAVGLISDLLRIATGPNDIVLDSFAGSGTTAHAVLALNKEDGGDRKFILVECEEYAHNITAERVRRVIDGVPDHRDESLREGLGGEFTYCTLGDPIDLEKILTGETLPSYEDLAAYLLYTASGVSAGVTDLKARNEDGLFHSTDSMDYYLLYKQDIEWLRTNKAVLNEDQARRISETGRKSVVFAADKYIGQRDLISLGISFSQIPYEIGRSASSRG